MATCSSRRAGKRGCAVSAAGQVVAYPTEGVIQLDHSRLARLEQELQEVLGALRAYRVATAPEDRHSPGQGKPPSAFSVDSVAEAKAPAVSLPGLGARSRLVRNEGGGADGALGDTGWFLLGDGWVLQAPDRVRIRLNICERAILVEMLCSAEHAISFDTYFKLIEETRALFGKKPLATSSMRMVLMRLMRKTMKSTAACPIHSVHGWGYRICTASGTAMNLSIGPMAGSLGPSSSQS